MIRDEARRRDLHDFLRAARARVEPTDVGLAAGPRRRVRGLHQADVAAVLGASVRWYTAFENGSGPGQRGPAPAVLDRLAEVLRLTPAERVRLYLLATGHEPAPGPADAPACADSRAPLERLIGLAGPHLPALLCDIAWNILAWNDALADHVLDPASLPHASRNVILWLFTPGAAQVISDIAAVREEEIGRVLLALARHPGDPQLSELAARLRQLPAARRVWHRQHVPGRTSISPRQIHQRGSAAVTGSDMISAEFGQLRLLIIVPRDTWPATRPREPDQPRHRSAPVRPGYGVHGG